MIIELNQNQLKELKRVKRLLDTGYLEVAEFWATEALSTAETRDKEKLRLCFAQLGLYV